MTSDNGRGTIGGTHDHLELTPHRLKQQSQALPV